MFTVPFFYFSFWSQFICFGFLWVSLTFFRSILLQVCFLLLVGSLFFALSCEWPIVWLMKFSGHSFEWSAFPLKKFHNLLTLLGCIWNCLCGWLCITMKKKRRKRGLYVCIWPRLFQQMKVLLNYLMCYGWILNTSFQHIFNNQKFQGLDNFIY